MANEMTPDNWSKQRASEERRIGGEASETAGLSSSLNLVYALHGINSLAPDHPEYCIFPIPLCAPPSRQLRLSNAN